MLGGMDRAMIERHLAQAEQHVALGERHLASQRDIVAMLERDNHDVTEAKRLLATFKELQCLHIADRDRLRAELKNADET
jgi:hypothetical protein